MSLEDELGLPELQALEAAFGARVARKLASAAGGWRDLSRQELNALGLTVRQQQGVLAVQELVETSYPKLPVHELANPPAVGRVYGARLGGLRTEVILAVALDGKNHFLQEIEVARGGCHGAAVTPSDVMRPVIRAGASAFLLVHNHPSGDPTPSAEDVAMTRALSAVSDVTGVPLLDHVVVGGRGGGWASLAELGVLETSTQENDHESDRNRQRAAESPRQ